MLDELRLELELDKVYDEFRKELEHQKKDTGEGEQESAEDAIEETNKPLGEPPDAPNESSEDDGDIAPSERDIDDVVDEVQKELEEERQREIDEVVEEVRQELEQEQEIECIIDEVQRELQGEKEEDTPHSRETREQGYGADSGDADEHAESDHDGQETSEDADQTEAAEEDSESGEREDSDESLDERINKALDEIEAEDEAERQESREDETTQESQDEPNEYEELEEGQKEVFESYGASREEVEEHWREGVTDDIEEYLEEEFLSETEDANDSSGNATNGLSETEAESETYHDAGDGMMYATKEGETTESSVEETQPEASETHESSDAADSEDREETDSESRPKLEGEKEQEQLTGCSESERPEQETPNECTQDKRTSIERKSHATDHAEESDMSTKQQESQGESSSEAKEGHSADQSSERYDSKSEPTTEYSTNLESVDVESADDEAESSTSPESVEEDESDRDVLDDSEPSPCFPHGLPREHSLFPEASQSEGLSESELEEVEELIRELEEQSEVEIEAVEDLERLLRENPEYYDDPMFDTYHENAVRYLRFKQRLRDRYSEEELETISYVDAARELGYSVAESSFWFDDRQLPYLIGELKKAEKHKSMIGAMREFLESRMSSVPRSQEQEQRAHARKRPGRYRPRMGYPTIRDSEVRTYDELERIVEGKFSWLKERKDFAKLMGDAKLYFELVREWKDASSVSRQDILKAIGGHGVSDETVKDWVKGRAYPQVFDIIHYGLSVEEGNALADEILKQLDGINDYKTYRRVMKSLYITDLLTGHKHYAKEEEKVRQFYRFIAALRNGGLHGDFARKSGAPESRTKHWFLYRRVPRYLKYAASTPKESPGMGKRWLPLLIRESGLARFIRVPLRIRSRKDIEDLLGQLFPVQSNQMRKWAKRYQKLEGAVAFMYLLGVIFSDGGFGRKKGTTTSVSLTASKRYNWSMAFGEAFCYCLGLLGITSSKNKDAKGKDKDGRVLLKHNWGSRHSPILSYIRKTLFGLLETDTKANQSMKMEWIFTLDKELRAALLRGIADGDGFATIRSFHAGIGTKANKPFIGKLLKSMGIKSGRYSNGVSILTNDAIRRAEAIRMFLIAEGKMGRLTELVAMLDSMVHRKIQGEEKDVIIRLHKDGLTDGQITSMLWADYGIARRPTTIRGFLKRQGVANKRDSQ